MFSLSDASGVPPRRFLVPSSQMMRFLALARLVPVLRVSAAVLDGDAVQVKAEEQNPRKSKYYGEDGQKECRLVG